MLGGNTGMWDEEDGFFYDVLRLPDGQAQRLKVRSMVGLLPLCAATIFEGEFREKYPEIVEAVPEVPRGTSRTVRRHPRSRQARRQPAGDWLRSWTKPSFAACWRRCSMRTSSSARSASARCRATMRIIPMSFSVGGQEYRVDYLPAESDTGMFGGNSNWRGPIWMPVNALIIRALAAVLRLLRQRFHRGMPHRLRAADEPVSGRRGDRTPPDQYFPERKEWPSARCTAESKVPGRSALARLHPVLRFSMATMAPGWGPAIRPAGPGSLLG